MSSTPTKPHLIKFCVCKTFRNLDNYVYVTAPISDTLDELKTIIWKRLNETMSLDRSFLMRYDKKNREWTHVDNSDPCATIDQLKLVAYSILNIEYYSEQSPRDQPSQHLFSNHNTGSQLTIRLCKKLKNSSDSIHQTASSMVTLGQLRKELWRKFGDSSESQSIYLWKENHWERLESDLHNKTLADLEFPSDALISLGIGEENIESKFPRGLVNLGNTCFMNSAFQCLINIPELTERILALNDTANAPILNAYIKLITRMRSGKHRAIEPSSLFVNISDNLPRYGHHRQQDAQEFMNYFLHLIHQELKTEETLITKLFYGKIRSSVKCLGCNQIEKTDESISFLPLPIANNNKKTFLFVKANGELRHLSIQINSSTITVGDLINCFLTQSEEKFTQELIQVVELFDNRVQYEPDSYAYLRYAREERLAFLERPKKTADDKYIRCHFVNHSTRERFRPSVIIVCPKSQCRYTDLSDQIDQLRGHLCSLTGAPTTACHLYWIDSNRNQHPLSVEANRDKDLLFIFEIYIEMDTEWINIYKNYCTVDHSTENSSLIGLLTDFFHEEPLDGEYHCSTCPKSTQARQKSDLCLPLPNVLIIQLKRFTYDIYSNEKIDTFISFPLNELDLDKYIIRDDNDPNQKTSSTKYDLVAVSNHTGSLISGHYTTYAKSIQNQDWYLFDDRYVRKLNSNNDVVTKNAYILVYVKKN